MAKKRVEGRQYLASGGRLAKSKALAAQMGKTVGTQSVSGPAQPSKAAPSVQYSPNKLGEGATKTVTDGKTQVTTSTKAAVEYIYGGSPDVSKATRQDYFNRHGQFPPCLNTSCKSYMKPHPNCLCFGAMEVQPLAHGGCVGSHKEECEHYADGGTVAENMKIHHNPKHTLDHVGVHHGLLGLLTKTGHSRSEDPTKPVVDYIDHARRGKKQVHEHMQNIFTTNHVEPNEHDRESLKNHLQFLRENPEKLLDVGGNLEETLPDHATHLVAKVGDAVNHFNTIKPKQIKAHPLDELSPVDKREENTYNRHIDIAQNPSVILNHVKDGTLLPSDISTLAAIYPELLKTLISKAGESLITAKSQNIEIPYKQKQTLSLLLGQPLDATQTPQAMQAILSSAGPQQMQQQQRNQPKKASGSELKQIDKSNAMYETSLEARQIRKNK